MIESRLSFLIVIALLLPPDGIFGDGREQKEASKVTDKEAAKAKVLAEVTRLGGASASTEAVVAEALERIFPDHLFYEVRFRVYPVARAIPPPLKPSNLFVVESGKDPPRLITDERSLERFFQDSVGPIRTDEQAKDAVRAWLRLAEVLIQDGFYGFELLDDSTKISRSGSERHAAGRAIVTRGGNGEITVNIAIDNSGKLVKLQPQVRIRPGPRPLCQASKLLDPDHLVRAMAEQDLIIMGPAAKDYLFEQRQNAKPELQRAIDRIWKRIVTAGP